MTKLCLILLMTSKFHFIEFTKSKIVLLWEGSNETIANAMRRIMQTEIPTLAIHIVHIFENTSVMPDEMIVHRLGLLPLHSENVDNFLYKKECECLSRQCNNCSVSIDLHFTCFDDYCNVTSRDLMSSNPSVYPVHDSTLPQEFVDGSESILIAKLKQNQQLHIKCTAQKGTGSQHAKWSPMVALVVRQFPVPNVDTEVMECIESGMQVCSHKLQHNPINGVVSVKDSDECRICQGRESIDFDNMQKQSLFVIETNGSLSPSSVLLQSIQILKKRVCILLHEFDNAVICSNLQ